MAANPRMVTNNTTFTYDGVSQRIQKGTIIDVPAGSPLETAIGSGNLVALTSQQITGNDDFVSVDAEGGLG